MRRVRGQAAVESAITLPLVVFMILGALQLFMVMQSRILAQYAASRAVRAGAQNFGDCYVMYDVATLVLLPAFDASFAKATNPGTRYASDALLRTRANHHYVPSQDGGRSGPIVWMDRLAPVGPFPPTEEEEWDLPPHRVFDVRMVFWAPLKIPFANQVFARIALAHFGLRELHTADPIMPVKRDGNWIKLAQSPRTEVANELQLRYDLKQYVFPVQITYATRMMSPARFRQQNCDR